MAAKTVNPQQAAAAWKQGLAGAGQKYAQGINNTQVNPMQLAAAQEQKYLANVQQAVSSGRYKNSLMAVDVNTWKQQATTVGVQNLVTGAQKGAAKYNAAIQKWAPILSQASAAANALPSGGMANALARVQAAMQVTMAAAGTA